MTSARQCVLPWLQCPPVPSPSNKMCLQTKLPVWPALLGTGLPTSLSTCGQCQHHRSSKDFLLIRAADWKSGCPRKAPHSVRGFHVTTIKYSSFPAVSMPCFWHETESEFESTSTWYPCLSWSDSEHLKVVSLGVSTMPPKTGLWSQLRISDPSIITEYNMFFLVAEVFLHHTLLPVLLKYQRFSALGKFWAVTQKWKKLLILDLCLHKPLEQQHPD